jgi:hypothetical protein
MWQMLIMTQSEARKRVTQFLMIRGVVFPKHHVGFLLEAADWTH